MKFGGTSKPSSGLASLMLGSLLFQTVQMGILPILLAQMLDDLGVSPIMIGFVLATSWISVLALGPFVPRLMKRWGSSVSFSLAACLTICGLLSIMVFGTIVAVIGCAILAGAGLIVRWVAADTLVISMSEANTKGTMIGYHEALMGLGIALGPLAFVAMEMRSVMMLSLVLCGIGIAFLILSQSGGDSEISIEPDRTASSSFHSLIIIGLCAALVAGFIENASVALLPIYYDAFGFTLSTSAIFVSGFGLGGTLLQPPLGLLADGFGVRTAQGLCVVATIFCCAMLVFLQPPFWGIATLLFLFGGAVGGLNTLAVIEAGTVLAPSQIPAAMTAIALVYTIGGVGGPVIAGWLLESETKSAMMIGFAASAAVLGAWLFFHNPAQKN